MSDTEIMDLVIVGGGPGGLTAGIYAMRAALKTVLIEQAVAGGQVTLSDEVENWPGTVNISGAELAMNFSQHAESYGLNILSEEVTSIEPGIKCHRVEMASGRSITAHALILATGGNPRKLQIPGEDLYYGKGVSYCAVCDGFFFKNKTVVVVGGGDSAAEEALYLAKIAKKVYIAHRRDELRASKILQERVLADCNIEMLWNTVLTKIMADDNGVECVGLKDTQNGEERTLEVDGVFIFIGFIPRNQLVPAGVNMNADGYVMSDEKCQTDIPGVYVIGDLRAKFARQIVTAAADGCIAALASAHYVETRREEPETCEFPDDLIDED